MQFTRWNNGGMEVVRGRVVEHADRTLTIHTDHGETVWTSCGHVREVRR